MGVATDSGVTAAAAAAFAAAAAAAAAMVATLWLLQDVYSHAFTPLSWRAPMHITAILLVVLLSTAAAHRAEPRQVAPCPSRVPFKFKTE